MDILTLIVENVTSTTFDDYCQENIFAPLGMTHTRFSADDYSPEELAIGYDWNETTSTNDVMPYFNNSGNPGGGGYFSTAEDMAKYMLMHLNPGISDGASVLNASSIELMHTDIAGSKRALGWAVRMTIGSRQDYQGHLGGPHNGFFSGNIIRSTLGAVILINEGPLSVAYDCYDLLTYIVDLAHKLLTEKTIPTTTTTVSYIFATISILVIIAFIHYYRRRRIKI